MDLKIIISSPSGAGKTTITRNLLKKVKNSRLSVSCTTRKPRPGEKHGTDYFFVSKNKFLELKKKNKFLETAKVFNNYYGTLKSEIVSKQKNKIILLDIDWQGARIIRKKIKKDLHSFYLLPPNFKELKKRLIKRHKENIKIAEERISNAKNDMKHWSEYDEVFVNKNINRCSKEIIKKIDLIILNRKKKNFINNFVKKFKFK